MAGWMWQRNRATRDPHHSRFEGSQCIGSFVAESSLLSLCPPLPCANFIHRRHACGDEIGSCKLCCNILRNKGDHGVYIIYIIWLHDLTQQYIYIMSQNSTPTKTQYSIQFVIEIHSPQLTRRPCQIIGWKYFNKHIFSKQKRTMVRCLKSSPTKKNNVRLPGRK